MNCFKHKHIAKHNADTNQMRSFFERTYDRLFCRYKISFFQKIRFPYFCIGILNSDKISDKAKSEFIEKFVIPYMYDEKMKWEIIYGQITFTTDHFFGSISYEEIYELMKQMNISKDVNINEVFIMMYVNFNPIYPYYAYGVR